VLPDGVETQSPDEFLSNVFELDPKGIAELLREQAADLVTRLMWFEELLDRLAICVPGFVRAVRDHMP
jgi:hypothetical protein